MEIDLNENVIPELENPSDMTQLLTNFLMFHAASETEEDNFRAGLMEQLSRTVELDRMMLTWEYIYAYRGSASAPARRMAASLARFAAVNGFWGSGGSEGRGYRVFRALGADLGVDGVDNPIDLDPPAHERFKSSDLLPE